MNNIIKKFKLKRKTANARKWKHQLGGIINRTSNTYLKFSNNATFTIYDLINAVNYLSNRY